MWQVLTAYAQLTSFRKSFGGLSEAKPPWVSKESGITEDSQSNGNLLVPSRVLKSMLTVIDNKLNHCYLLT